MKNLGNIRVSNKTNVSENLVKLLQSVFLACLLNKDDRTYLHFGLPNFWVFDIQFFVLLLVLHVITSSFYFQQIAECLLPMLRFEPTHNHTFRRQMFAANLLANCKSW